MTEPTTDAGSDLLRAHAEEQYADELAALAPPTTARARRAGSCRPGPSRPTSSAATLPTAP